MVFIGEASRKVWNLWHVCSFRSKTCATKRVYSTKLHIASIWTRLSFVGSCWDDQKMAILYLSTMGFGLFRCKKRKHESLPILAIFWVCSCQMHLWDQESIRKPLQSKTLKCKKGPKSKQPTSTHHSSRNTHHPFLWCKLKPSPWLSHALPRFLE